MGGTVTSSKMRISGVPRPLFSLDENSGKAALSLALDHGKESLVPLSFSRICWSKLSV